MEERPRKEILEGGSKREEDSQDISAGLLEKATRIRNGARTTDERRASGGQPDKAPDAGKGIKAGLLTGGDSARESAAGRPGGLLERAMRARSDESLKGKSRKGAGVKTGKGIVRAAEYAPELIEEYLLKGDSVGLIGIFNEITVKEGYSSLCEVILSVLVRLGNAKTGVLLLNVGGEYSVECLISEISDDNKIKDASFLRELAGYLEAEKEISFFSDAEWNEAASRRDSRLDVLSPWSVHPFPSGGGFAGFSFLGRRAGSRQDHSEQIRFLAHVAGLYLNTYVNQKMFQPKKKEPVSIRGAGKEQPGPPGSEGNLKKGFEKSGSVSFIKRSENITPGVQEERGNASDGGVLQEDSPEMEEDRYFQEVSQDEVYKSIDEEIQKTKKAPPVNEEIKSEKRGIVLPLVVNIAIIAAVSIGLTFYLLETRGKVKEEGLSSSVTGVEAEVIRELQRRSEEQVEQQRRKLDDAVKRLEALKKERDFFLQNQEEILKKKEMELDEAYRKDLEEARARIAASGISDVNKEFEKEKQRLFEELTLSKKQAQTEIEEVKRNYERELSLKEEQIQSEVRTYTFQLNALELRLREEEAKLKEAKETVKNVTLQRQEYEGYQKQLESVYDRSLGYFSKGEYERGIEELKTLLPVIDNAREAGLTDESSLRIEENLVLNMVQFAEREKNRVDLEQMGRETYKAAQALEKEGKLEEALSRYLTVYTIVDDSGYKNRAMNRARALMDRMYEARTESGIAKIERTVDNIFSTAMNHKKKGEYDQAVKNLEEILTRYPESSKRQRALDELLIISDLITARKEARMKEDSDRKLNQQALLIMNNAESSYRGGDLEGALELYEEVVRNYKDSDYTEKALEEIKRINSQMREVNITTTLALDGGGSITGVVVQILPGSNVLINLGSEDNIEIGNELRILRKAEKGVEIIGSLKVYSVSPKTSRGKLVYFDKDIKVGDIVSFSQLP